MDLKKKKTSSKMINDWKNTNQAEFKLGPEEENHPATLKKSTKWMRILTWKKNLEDGRKSQEGNKFWEGVKKQKLSKWKIQTVLSSLEALCAPSSSPHL